MDDYRFCSRCWDWVPNRIGTHPCVKRPRPDVLPIKPGTETRHLTVPEQKVMQKALRASMKPVEKIETGLKEALAIAKGEANPARVTKVKKAVTSERLMRDLDVLAATKLSAPITKTARERIAKKLDLVAEVSAQPEPKNEPVCQPDAKKLTPTERAKKWRQDNPEKAKKFMREYQQKRRAALKGVAQ